MFILTPFGYPELLNTQLNINKNQVFYLLIDRCMHGIPFTPPFTSIKEMNIKGHRKNRRFKFRIFSFVNYFSINHHSANLQECNRYTSEIFVRKIPT